MVFGADWDEPLTPEEMAGRAYTVAELRMRTPIVIATASRFEATTDAQACGPCKARHGAPFAKGDPVDHPECKNPNGCRCVVVLAAE
jgi:hypothetical protein